jgi:hypothetical protein
MKWQRFDRSGAGGRSFRLNGRFKQKPDRWVNRSGFGAMWMSSRLTPKRVIDGSCENWILIHYDRSTNPGRVAAMAEQVVLNLSEELSQRARESADLTQRDLEEVLLEWLNDRSQLERDRSRSSNDRQHSESMWLKRVNIGFSADWWTRYRALIADRQAETIGAEDLAELIGMSESLELANVSRVEALGELAKLRGCSIEAVMESLGIVAHG